jgi:mannitol-1-phosphate 5-dehydrogenase
MLAIDEGGNPIALAQAIAAGLRYDPAGDPAAQKIQAMIRDSGFDAALRDVCGIHPEGKLADLVKKAYAEL